MASRQKPCHNWLFGFISSSDETLRETANETARATADGLSPDFRQP
jgi:hypothetical protein